MCSGLNRTYLLLFTVNYSFMHDSRNYPCCTVNHPQAFPKFWANSFVIDQSDQSLVHVFLGPMTFSGIVGLNHIKDKNNSRTAVNVGMKKILLYSSHLGPSVKD